ncbi:DUF3473 domain-containing protein [Myxococcota bacterium]|nr:DUF3473 domain-containing protein [Myxococcota bacterium]
MKLNALSVDLEDYFQVSNFDACIARNEWDQQPRRVVDNTRRLLDLFDQHGTCATFFVLGWVAEREAALIREIASRGHEIACHGYGHELVYEIGRKRFEADIARAKAEIQDACGQRVLGYRAPSYSITDKSLWALDVLAEQGFEYDSSIFPIRHHRYGIPDFPRLPQNLRLPEGGQIIEFPMTTLPFAKTNLPWAGGAYLRFLPAPLFRWGFRRLAARREPTVLYLHPWEIDPDQPRQPVGRAVRVNHYWHLDQTLTRMDRLMEAHRFSTLRDVIESLRVANRLPEHTINSAPSSDAAPLQAIA